MHKSNGFTLVELITTTCVLVVIAMIAAPSILNQLANMEAKRIRFDLKNSLTVSKAESHIRRQNLIACLTDLTGRCNKNSDTQFLLFIDKNANNHFDERQDVLIYEQNLNPKYASLHLRASGRHHIKFFGDTGMPRGHFGHIKYCPSAHFNDHQYQISFNKLGIIKFKPNKTHDTGCDD